MANQKLKGTAAELNLKNIGIGDIALVLDDEGVWTGQVRIGVDDVLGGVLIEGAVGSGAVASINGLTGAVTLGLGDLSGVDLTGVDVDDLLGWNGTNWVPRSFVGTLAGLTDVGFSTLQDGQVLMWSTADESWINAAPDQVPGGSDNLGNHTATADLNLSGQEIFNIDALRLLNGWRILDSAGGTIILDKNLSGTPSPALTLQHTAVAGAGFLALPDYGSSRADDAGTISLTNLAYFQSNGILRKANRSSNANAFKAIPADAFGFLASLSGATLGQALIFNGTNFVPDDLPPAGGASAFTDLTDVPASYATHGGKSVRVNAGATALEFYTLVTPTFLALADTPANYTAAGGRTLKVNAGATAVEFVVHRLLGAADIEPGTPADGQGIVWNNSLSRFDFVDCLVTEFGATPYDHGSPMFFDETVGAAGAWVLIPPGTNGDVLTMVAGAPAWA